MSMYNGAWTTKGKTRQWMWCLAILGLLILAIYSSRRHTMEFVASGVGVPHRLQIFYQVTANEGFTEERSVLTTTSLTGYLRGGEHGHAPIPIVYAKVDVPESTTTIRIDWDAIGVQGFGFRPFKSATGALGAINQCDASLINGGVEVNSVAPGANDPWIVLHGVQPVTSWTVWPFIAVTLIAVLSMINIKSWNKFLKISLPFACIYLIFFYVTIAILFVWISPAGANPDEQNHIQSAQYFMDWSHWWFPSLCDPACLETIGNVYAHSYLFDGDLSYLVLGKLGVVISSCIGEDFRVLRLSNLTFFLGMLTMSAWILDQRRWLLLFPLCLPQVWYVAVYVNGDAFGLGLSILGVALAVQIACNSRKLTSSWGCGFMFVIGLIFCSKFNYAIVAWTLLTFTAVCFYFKNLPVVFPILARLGLFLLLPLILFKLPYYQNNGYRPVEVAKAIKEESASALYRPSIRGKSLLDSLTQGDGLKSVVLNPDWHFSTARSFVGGFGLMSIFLPHKAIALFYAVLIFTITSAIIRWQRLSHQVIQSIGWSLAILAAFILPWAQSLAYSLTWDYQAQGRYVQPLIPLLLLVIALFTPRCRAALLFSWLIMGVLLLGLSVAAYINY